MAGLLSGRRIHSHTLREKITDLVCKAKVLVDLDVRDVSLLAATFFIELFRLNGVSRVLQSLVFEHAHVKLVKNLTEVHLRFCLQQFLTRLLCLKPLRVACRLIVQNFLSHHFTP